MGCRLDYPGIGPEHSALKDWGRAEYFSATDQEALDAFQNVSRLEGIIPALETSHAFAYLDVSPPYLLSDPTQILITVILGVSDLQSFGDLACICLPGCEPSLPAVSSYTNPDTH